MFYRAAWVFLDKALEAGMYTLKLQMPRSFPLYDAERQYETTRLKEWFEARARELAAKFDARNGNDYFTTKLLDIAAIKALKDVV
jgi:hypothetical protein